jgi:hypothetical protein
MRIQCPASVTMQVRYPELEPSPAALEGEQAHLVASDLLDGREHVAPYVTEQMRRGAELYASYVRRHVPVGGHIEQRIEIPRVHALCFGTPDFYYVGTNRDGRPWVFLADYKFGFGVVEAFENQQIVEYTAGILDKHGLSDLNTDVHAAIIQPRAHHRDGPIREWKFRASAIRALVNIGSNAAHEALGPSPRAQTGPECVYCSARHACPTLQRVAGRAADLAGAATPVDLTPEQMGTELALLRAASDRLTARVDGLTEQLQWHLKQGRAVPGWALERGAGRERWARGDAAAIALGAALGFDLARPPEAITPLQARERGMPIEHIPGLVERQAGGAKLVPDDGTAARQVFGQVATDAGGAA